MCKNLLIHECHDGIHGLKFCNAFKASLLQTPTCGLDIDFILSRSRNNLHYFGKPAIKPPKWGSYRVLQLSVVNNYNRLATTKQQRVRVTFRR